ncbi:MAG: sulfite exporter TauE/SafE family protein, partial [Rhodothermales bacterium]|nr:sulfite exporter TauE/SafE family protein [Rhodothermales bacterium]
MHDLPLVFAAGLLGSAHCVGMCGGFVLALRHPARARLHQGLYFAGKTLTYTLFGAAAGAFGAALSAALGPVQDGLAVGLGLVLVVLGLGLCGVLRRFDGFASVARLGFFSQALGRLVAKPSASATVGLGML